MNKFKLFWATSGVGIRLIVVNVIVFLLINIPLTFLHLLKFTNLQEAVFQQLALPGDIHQLLYKPWTLITHMFVHYNILHVAFNMITLNFSYQIFNRYLDDRRFLNVYFVSGLAGAVVFVASVNLFPFLQIRCMTSRLLEHLRQQWV